MWYPKYDVVYHVVLEVGQQLELADESGKIHIVKVQEIEITYQADELKWHLPDETVFWHATKYKKHIENKQKIHTGLWIQRFYQFLQTT